MESTIYINTTLKEARANSTGAGLPEVVLTLLAQWLCHVRFFASGEEPALLASPTFVLAIKETPTGTALVRTEDAVENENGNGYDFDIPEVDGESLRALLADNESLPLVIEIEWTVGGRTERVHLPCNIINAYNRPGDPAPDPALEASETWLTERALRYDEAQTLTSQEKAQAQENLGITNGVDGASAYEIAIEYGFAGTEEEWLASLIGDQGAQGIQGPQGIQGEQGPPGADSDLVEPVAATSRETNLTVSGSGAADLDGDYLDIDIGGGATVRAWFNVDGATSPPAAPGSGRLLQISLGSGADPSATASAIAAALNADPDLEAGAISSTITLTQPAGNLAEPTSTDITSLIISGSTPGTDASERIRAIDGSQLLNVPGTVEFSNTNRVLVRKSAGAGLAEEATASEVLDMLGNTPGGVLFRAVDAWQILTGSGLLRLNSGSNPTIIDPSGVVVQTKYFEKKDTAVVTGTTFAAVFSGSITLKHPTSRVVMMAVLGCGQAASNAMFIRTVRNSGVIVQGDAAGSRTRVSGGHYTNQAGGLQSVPVQASDTPGAGTHTYEIHVASNAAGSVHIGRTATDTDGASFPRASATMILMEVLP